MARELNYYCQADLMKRRGMYRTAGQQQMGIRCSISQVGRAPVAAHALPVEI